MKTVFRSLIQGMCLILTGASALATPPAEQQSNDGFESAAFQVPGRWEYGPPLIAPERREQDPSDQNLIVDPNNLRFLFQGMLDAHKSGKGYGQFQWRLGMLTPVETWDEREAR